jgi:hypothetical protein
MTKLLSKTVSNKPLGPKKPGQVRMDFSTLILGTVGTALGIIALVQRMNDDRVRLKVIPKLAFACGGGVLRFVGPRGIQQYMDTYGPPQLAIEVINLGKFAVTVDEVGMCEGNMRGGCRAALIVPILPHGDRWPKRLEPRESVTAYFDASAARDHRFSWRTRVYASTACGVTKTGMSAAFRELRSLNRQYHAWLAAEAAERASAASAE